MAVPNPGGNVYKRDTPEDLHQAWNAVIRKVNDERENPPEDTDCEALSLIDEVEENHIWTKTDVEELREAIDEMCPYSWTEDLTYWKDAIIEEIEEALDREWGGWGDEDECCEQKCVPACPDCGEEEDSFDARVPEGCLIWPFWQCMTDYIQWKSVVRPAAKVYAQLVSLACSRFYTYHAAYCHAVREVEKLEGELETLETIRDAECAKSPPNDCEATQAAVDAKQIELDAEIVRRDEYQGEMIAASEEADSNALIQAAIIETASHPEQQNMWSLVTDTNHPLVGRDCEIEHGYRGVERCRWRWNLGFQSEGSEHWNIRWSGFYTPNGLPYATILSVYAPFSPNYCMVCCWSINPDWCNNPESNCGQMLGETCPVLWRVHAYSDKTSCGAYDSGTGEPC